MFDDEKDERILGLDNVTATMATFNAQGFILEILLAKILASLPPAAADSIVEDIINKSDLSYFELSARPQLSEHMYKYLVATATSVERLARQALVRSAQIRGTG